jgi:head decoration protein D
MPSLSEGKYAGEFILSESKGGRSRDNIVVLSGENLKAGHVVGRRLVAPTFGAAAALGTNTGNGVFGAVTMGTNLGARRGVYRVVITEPAANAGIFEVFGPDGQLVGDGAVAALFDNEIQFTLADGATDFVSGDAFTIVVSAGTYKYKEYDVADADGGQRPIGVLYDNVDASAADKAGVLIARDAEIRAADLTWFAGATQAQKDIALDALAALGIIARL